MCDSAPRQIRYEKLAEKIHCDRGIKKKKSPVNVNVAIKRIFEVLL